MSFSDNSLATVDRIVLLQNWPLDDQCNSGKLSNILPYNNSDKFLRNDRIT